MPVIRNEHRKRARFEQGMADGSASNMERMIHAKLADLHAAAAEALTGELDAEAAAK